MVRFLLLMFITAVFCNIGLAADDEVPDDEKCRKEENVYDCIIRMNRVDSDKDTYSSNIKAELFEGDIVWTKDLKALISEMRTRLDSGMSSFDAISRGRWSKQGKYAYIPYTYASGFAYSGVVEQAIQEYNKHTCIRFQRYSGSNQNHRNAGGYIEFMHGGGCYSMIGRQGGKQQVSLGRGCNYKGTAIHEMMHALGFFHEQSRRDRDRYITINWRNINRAMYYNFEMYRQGQADTYGEPYDKQSVMHYGNYAFSTNGQMTIVSKSNPRETFGGQFRGLSRIDINQLNKYYQCSSNPTVTVKPPTTSCKDDYTFCTVLNRYCSNKWVITNCKKTCNKCAKKKRCSDLSTSCPGWAQRGYCTGQYQPYMKANCKKSCPAYCK